MLESKVSEILENILGLLNLEGSFEVEEKPEFVSVMVETDDAGRLIGKNGDTLSALQLLVNQILSKQIQRTETEFKRVIIDISNWRKNKEDDLAQKAKNMAEQVIAENKPMELEPMPAWQRRVIHLAIEGIKGVTSESQGEGVDRHLVIKPA